MEKVRCPWCGSPHATGLKLCLLCESIAVTWKQRDGVPIRLVREVEEEPDD